MVHDHPVSFVGLMSAALSASAGRCAGEAGACQGHRQHRQPQVRPDLWLAMLAVTLTGAGLAGTAARRRRKRGGH